MRPPNCLTASHNPKVAGSNPAPATSQGPSKEGPWCLGTRGWRDSGINLARLTLLRPVSEAETQMPLDSGRGHGGGEPPERT